MYCQHLPTHWWTNHSELAYLIRDPSPTTPRELLRKRQLKRWMMQPVSRRDPPSRRNNIECLERYWVRPLNTKGTHQWNENELRTACLLRLWVSVDADFLLDIYVYIYMYIYISYFFLSCNTSNCLLVLYRCFCEKIHKKRKNMLQVPQDVLFQWSSWTTGGRIRRGRNFGQRSYRTAWNRSLFRRQRFQVSLVAFGPCQDGQEVGFVWIRLILKLWEVRWYYNSI